jgi:hypothetical protein
MPDDRQPEVLTRERSDFEKVFAGAQMEPEALTAPEQSRGPRPVGDSRAAFSFDQPVVLRHTPEVDKLFMALAKAQGSWGEVEKTLKANIASRKEGGRSYAFSYETLADVLDAVLPHTSGNGLSVLQFPFTRATTIQIRTVIGHESGQMLWNDLIANISGIDPQAVGSGISYLRRYALKSILGLSAADEDDDGRLASRGNEKTEPIKQAERKSAQDAGAAVTYQRAAAISQTPVPKPAPEQAAVQAPPSQVGIVLPGALVDRGNGVFAVQLDSGFVCGTRDTDLLAVLYSAQKHATRIELLTAPPKTPGFLPRLEKVLVRPSE